jgi:O-antigen/teichoic acid export membrane protein
MVFAKESGKVLIGITTQRILSIVMVPVVAWLLGPIDYGIFNVGISICTLCSVIGGLAMEASIAISVSKEQAFARALCTSLLGLFSGILFLALAYLSRPFLLKYYSPEAVSAIIWMMPFLVPLTVMNMAMQNYVAYLGKFEFIATGDIVYSIANYVTLISVYFLLYKDYHALIIASIMAFSVRLSIFFEASMGLKWLVNAISSARILKEIWETRHFIKFNLPCNILNTANVQLPPALINLRYTEDVVGLFSMARNIITIPANLSSRSLGQVFYPKAAQEYREGHGLEKITWQTFIYSCRLTIFPTIFIASAAGFVLPFLLGQKWSGVAIYTILLLPMVLLNAIQTQIGVGFIFNILNEPSKILWGNLFLFLSRIGPLAFILFFMTTNPYFPVLVYSAGSGIGYAILLAWIFTATSISVYKACSEWLKHLGLALLCVSPMLLSFLTGKVLVLVLSLLFSVFFYGLVVWFFFLNHEQRGMIIARTLGWLPFLKGTRSTMTKGPEE